MKKLNLLLLGIILVFAACGDEDIAEAANAEASEKEVFVESPGGLYTSALQYAEGTYPGVQKKSLLDDGVEFIDKNENVLSIFKAYDGGCRVWISETEQNIHYQISVQRTKDFRYMVSGKKRAMGTAQSVELTPSEAFQKAKEYDNLWKVRMLPPMH